MQQPLKGIYSVNGEGKLVASLAEKIPLGTFAFMVTQIPVDMEMTAWCADLIPAGLVPDGHEKAGHPFWKLSGHPKNARLILDGQNLLECDESLNRRRTWCRGEEMSGLTREHVGAPKKIFPSENFKETVLNANPLVNKPYSPSTQVVVESCAKSIKGLPDPVAEPMERQRKLIQAYTMETPLYHEMNRALREDSLDKMRFFGSYIKELRDVFKTDHQDQLIEPFKGTIWRGINFPDPEASIADFQVGTEFVWPAFTSMTTNKQVALNFGNITFEIDCKPPEGLFEDDKPEYAPADICKFSVFPSESEILFPPNISFRVLRVDQPTDENGLNVPLVVCKVVGFDTDEGIQKFSMSPAPSVKAKATPPETNPPSWSSPDVNSSSEEWKALTGKNTKKIEQLQARLEDEISRLDMLCTDVDERMKVVEAASKEKQEKDKAFERRIEGRFAEQLADRITSLERGQSQKQRYADLLGLGGSGGSPALENKVAAVEKELRLIQRSVQEVIDGRASDLQRITKDAEDKDEQTNQSVREAMQRMATWDRSLKTYGEKQVSMEHRLTMMDQRWQQDSQNQGMSLRRLNETCQQELKKLEERVAEAHVALRQDMNELIKRTMLIDMEAMARMSGQPHQAWQNSMQLPGTVPVGAGP